MTNDQQPMTNYRSGFFPMTTATLRTFDRRSGRIDCYDRSAGRILTLLPSRVEFPRHVDSLVFRYSESSIFRQR